jgi:hypothetical protein
VHLGSRLFAACSPGVYNMTHDGKVTDQDAQGQPWAVHSFTSSVPCIFHS